MKILLTYLIIACTLNCASQTTETTEKATLIIKRKGKQHTIKNFSDVEILSVTDSSGITKVANAYITPTLRLANDSFEISVCQLSIEKQLQNSETQVVTTEYPLSGAGSLKLHINQIDKITVGRNCIKVSTGLLCTLSILSAIAVAPAMYVGPNYNYTRYRQMVGGSLLSAAAFLSLNLSFGSKTYKFNSENLDKNWQLQAVETK